MLGHASAAMTQDVYAGLFADDLDEVADRLDQAYEGHSADRLETTGPNSSVTSFDCPRRPASDWFVGGSDGTLAGAEAWPGRTQPEVCGRCVCPFPTNMLLHVSDLCGIILCSTCAMHALSKSNASPLGSAARSPATNMRERSSPLG